MRKEQDPITGEDKCALTSVEEIDAALQVLNILRSFKHLSEDDILRIKTDLEAVTSADERPDGSTMSVLVSGHTGFFISEVLKPETSLAPILEAFRAN